MIQTLSSPPDTHHEGGVTGTIRQAQQQVARSVVDELATLSGLSKKEVAALIGLSERAIFKTTAGVFSVLISEHLLRLNQVFGHGLAVFDQNKKNLVRWLRTPLPELAAPETGFYPRASPPPPPLAQMSTKSGPYSLVEAAVDYQRSQQERTPHEVQHPYPTPLSVLNTAQGAALVDAVFTRIEAGVYS